MMKFPDANDKDLRNNLCQKFCHSLQHAPDSSIALKYLEERGYLDDGLIEDFKIGWCPQSVGRISGLELDFSGRVIFPIMDESGDVVAFTGRLPRDKKDISKEEKRWLHESYAKTHFLYGSKNVIENIYKKKYVIFVEGQMDVLACYRYGFKNTVGLLGTAFSKHTQYRFRSITKNFVLMFDGDKGGREAATKTKKELEKRNSFEAIEDGTDYNVIDIDLSCHGNNYDPDDFFRKYKENGTRAIKELMYKKNGRKKFEDTRLWKVSLN